MTTFVLIPGGWHGGYSWQPTADLLVAQGHQVRALMLDGLGPDRRSAGPEPNLDDHIAQVVAELDRADGPVILCGHQFVDTIGVDSSDFYPAATDEQSWDEQLNSDHGLAFWLAFAQQHDKSLSFPEWDSVAGDQDEAGHDNPFYIRQMFNFFQQHADQIGYEAYFDTTEGYWQSPLRGPTVLPRTAGAYRKAWSGPLPGGVGQSQ